MLKVICNVPVYIPDADETGKILVHVNVNVPFLIENTTRIS